MYLRLEVPHRTGLRIVHGIFLGTLVFSLSGTYAILLYQLPSAVPQEHGIKQYDAGLLQFMWKLLAHLIGKSHAHLSLGS